VQISNIVADAGRAATTSHASVNILKVNTYDATIKSGRVATVVPIEWSGESMDTERQQNAFVDICGGYAEVEAALRTLQAHCCGLSGVSILGQDLSSGREVVGCYQNGRSSMYWGPLAAFWEELWELLDGCAVFTIPNFGGLLIAGPFVTTLVASLENASIFPGMTAIGSALYSLGISSDDVRKYEANLKDRRLLLIVQGAAARVGKAQRLLEGACRLHGDS